MLSRSIIHCPKKHVPLPRFSETLVCDVGVYLEQNDIGFITIAICGGFSPYIAQIPWTIWADSANMYLTKANLYPYRPTDVQNKFPKNGPTYMRLMWLTHGTKHSNNNRSQNLENQSLLIGYVNPIQKRLMEISVQYFQRRPGDKHIFHMLRSSSYILVNLLRPSDAYMRHWNKHHWFR